MAIKSVSQLDRFDNDNSFGSFELGGNLHLFDDKYLTYNDKIGSILNNWRSYSSQNYSTADDTYWGSLFEISKPINHSTTSDSSNPAVEYDSQSITYQNLMENILWDAKSYLNARHNLSDFNFLQIFHGNYTFTGNKTFNDNVHVNSTLSSLNLTANNSLLTNLTAINLTATNLTTEYLTANYLSVTNKLHISCDITAKDRDRVFDGWAYGLVNRVGNLSTGALTREKTNVGTYDGRVTTGLTGGRVGDPVCFVDGRPYELTAVNYAMSAFTLVDEVNGAWNVGNGTYRRNADKTQYDDNAQNTERYSAVYFRNGKPYTTNVIKYAECAYWSDLGERYLADEVYEPGTLVKFGGEKELTIADDEVNAIVSTKAFELNNKLIGGTVIALCGRVPTKVKGKIEKFDKIMLSDIPGVACKWDGASRVIGRALERNLYENIKLVECVTRFEI